MTNWQDTYNTLLNNMKRLNESGDRKAAAIEAAKIAELLFTEAKASTVFEHKQQFANRAAQFLEQSVEIRDGKSLAPAACGGGQTTSQQKIKNRDVDNEEAVPQFPLIEPDKRFSDVAGLENVKQTLLDYVNTFRHIEAARKRGLKIGGGMLFYGPPGTGKTMLAQAVAAELGLKICPASGAELKGRCVGDSEKNVKALFEQVRSNKDFVLFIDEIDSFAKERSGSTSENANLVLEQLLPELDGAGRNNDGMVFLAATNNPWNIDEALMSRFSETCYIPLPDTAARKAIFGLQFKKMPVSDTINIDMLVEQTDGLGGREIVAICERANKISFRKLTQTGVDEPVGTDDFTQAMQNVKPRVSEKSLQKYQEWENR
ncbi:hypothetical protein FACS1894170_00440 [Planctomycetales bacterium]|nr:hypothetical protein FACS1894170_00440 [Planctomycetales bacterium]